MRFCMEEQMAMGLRGGGAGEDARCVLTWDVLRSELFLHARLLGSFNIFLPSVAQCANERDIADASSRTRCSIMGARC